MLGLPNLGLNSVPMGGIVRPGDYLLDESGNYLTDESGNKLTG